MEEFSKKNKKIDKLYYHISSIPIFNLINQKENYKRFGGKKNFNNFQIDNLDYSNNPGGLWISCGTSWLDYTRDYKVRDGFYDFIYSIRLNKKYKNKIKKISTKSSFSKFATKYNNKNATKLSDTIDWKKVKNDFDGLIICPYNYENFNSYVNNLKNIGVFREFSHYLINSIFKKEALKKKYNLRNEWQSYWRIQSGVIWSPEDVISEIELIAYWNNNKKEWVKPDKKFEFRIIKPNQKR